MKIGVKKTKVTCTSRQKTQIKILIEVRVEKLDEFEYLDKFLIGLLTGIVKDVRNRIDVWRK